MNKKDRQQVREIVNRLNSLDGDSQCPLGAQLNEVEGAALNWIHRVCFAIVDQGPDHRSYTKAVYALSALYKLNEFEQRMHDQSHAEQAAITQMMGKDMPRA